MGSLSHTLSIPMLGQGYIEVGFFSFINEKRGQEGINLGKFTESTSCFLVAL